MCDTIHSCVVCVVSWTLDIRFLHYFKNFKHGLLSKLEWRHYLKGNNSCLRLIIYSFNDIFEARWGVIVYIHHFMTQYSKI